MPKTIRQYVFLTYTVWLGIPQRDFMPWNVDLRIAVFCYISLYSIQTRTSAHYKKHWFFNIGSKRRVYYGDKMQKDNMRQACGMCGTKSDEFTGKHEGNKPVGRPRRNFENNIKVDLTEVWLEGMRWIWRRTGNKSRALVYMVINFRVP